MTDVGRAYVQNPGQGRSITIDGSAATIKALAAFEPDLHKRLRKEIRTALNRTREAAMAAYPTGLWTIRFNGRKALFGSIVATGGGLKADKWGESGGGVRAAIFEFAGSVQEGKTPQARGLIQHLNEKYGGTGRFLWDAWDKTGKAVLDDIAVSFRAAEAEFQARLDAAGEDY